MNLLSEKEIQGTKIGYQNGYQPKLPTIDFIGLFAY